MTGKKQSCIEELYDTKIKVEERGKSAVFLNGDRGRVLRIRVDGCLILNETASDWIVSRGDFGDVVIELKGCNVNHAVEQISATLEFWRRHTLCARSQAALIVCSRYPRFDTTLQRGKVRLLKLNVPLWVESRNLEYEFARFFPQRGP